MSSSKVTSTPPTAVRLTRGFGYGIRASIDGFFFMCRHPSLWAYGVWPVVLNVIVAFVVWLGAFRLGQWLVEWATQGLGDGLWDRIQWWIYFTGMLLLTLGIAFIGYLVLMSVFCSFAFSKLARKVELHLGAKEEELAEVSTMAGIIDALRASLKLVVVNVLLLALHVVPGVGSLAAVSLGLYVDAFILGSEFLGFPLELRGKRWLERQEFAKTWRGATLGIGVVVTGLMLVPVVGAVFQTTAVVGAVLIHRRLTGLPIDVPTEEQLAEEQLAEEQLAEEQLAEAASKSESENPPG